ncbi:MAG: hypothetical protein J7F05_21100 [Trichodesmium erythraeum GBRTRLIN201]|nr:hypothetical protein [Trichodesmium erythraeum GBRTRLIN201]
MTTAKYFPSHGDTTVDSHFNLPVISHSESRLVTVELSPFVKASASEIDSVMSNHLLILSKDEKYQ